MSCNSITRLSSVNGTSIGTPMLDLALVDRGTRSSRAGNGQSGLVSFGTMRVSACTPSVRITQSAMIFGCAAKARVGRTSSHRFGAPARGLPSEIERHICVHCLRAAISSVRSLRSLLERLPICSFTVLSSSGFTSLETLSLMPATACRRRRSRRWPVRLGSIRQFGSSAGCDVTVTLPRMSARWSSTRVVSFCTSPPSLSPSRPLSAPVRLPPWLAIWPVTRSEPLSVVEMLRPGGRAGDRERPARDGPADVGLAEQVGAADFRSCRSGRAGRWPPSRRGWRGSRPRPARR